MGQSESPVSEGETLYVRVNKRSRFTDGLAEGIANIYDIRLSQAYRMMIHVRGDVEEQTWYQVTVSEVRTNHIVAEAESEVDDPRIEPPHPRTVWWVDTSHADCFHGSRTCEMLAKREGDIVRTQVDSLSTPLPGEIADMRRCQHCF